MPKSESWSASRSAAHRSTDSGRGAALRLANQRVLRRSTTLPELVLGQGRPPTGLRPAWLDGGVARLWSSGAAVPRVESASTAPERRPDGGERWGETTRRCPERSVRRRGTRAGRRVQQRRHRLCRLTHRDGAAPPGQLNSDTVTQGIVIPVQGKIPDLHAIHQVLWTKRRC